jgi:hypothetical protein
MPTDARVYQWPNSFNGMRVFINPNLTQPVEPIHTQVPRSWRERLCLRSYQEWVTAPFEPWKRTRTVTTIPQVPTCYQVGNVFYMHPAIADQLRRINQ